MLGEWGLQLLVTDTYFMAVFFLALRPPFGLERLYPNPSALCEVQMGKASQQGQLVSSSSLWIWAYDRKASPHTADAAQKECLMQHSGGTVPTGNELQRMPILLLQKIMTNTSLTLKFHKNSSP